jgi:hypothetical protein
MRMRNADLLVLLSVVWLAIMCGAALWAFIWL